MTKATTTASSTSSPYTVVYAPSSRPMAQEQWQYFECHADDIDHAEDQCESFDPTAHVLWTIKGHGPHTRSVAAGMARWWRRQVEDEQT